ncbi:MAG: hypothetical protein EFT35_00610 [Methanophagales archaeon ANME-1-THS]|nr:MAG: hypothetical protein EFT35_00610 [Methanophagales archaeon ANME-1-THS]
MGQNELVQSQRRMMTQDTNALVHRKLERILRILEDQRLHSITEMVERVHLSAEQVAFLFRFLAAYSFIRYNEQDETAIISTELLALK